MSFRCCLWVDRLVLRAVEGCGGQYLFSRTTEVIISRVLGVYLLLLHRKCGQTPTNCIQPRSWEFWFWCGVFNVNFRYSLLWLPTSLKKIMRNILRPLIMLQINHVKLLLHGEMLDEEDVGGRGKPSFGEDAYPWGTGDVAISGCRAWRALGFVHIWQHAQDDFPFWLDRKASNFFHF